MTLEKVSGGECKLCAKFWEQSVNYVQSFQLKVSLFWILWSLFSLIILMKQRLYSPKQHPYACMCMSSYRPIMGGVVLVKFLQMYQPILTVTFVILPSLNFFYIFFSHESCLQNWLRSCGVFFLVVRWSEHTDVFIYYRNDVNKLQYCRPNIRQCVVAHLAQFIQWFCLHSYFDTVYTKLCSNARGRNAIRQALEQQMCK